MNWGFADDPGSSVKDLAITVEIRISRNPATATNALQPSNERIALARWCPQPRLHNDRCRGAAAIRSRGGRGDVSVSRSITRPVYNRRHGTRKHGQRRHAPLPARTEIPLMPHTPPSPPVSNAMATMRDDTNAPRTSIANLILPQRDIRPDNLLSLSQLAATMTPASSADLRRRQNINRTKSVPIRKQPPVEPQLPDDTRRNHRMSRTTSVAAPLGVAHAPAKRLSRRGSGLSGLSNAARNAIASSTSGLVSGESSSEPPGTPRAPTVPSNPLPSPTPSPAVLRPINSNPIAGAGYHSKHTSASNSIESCVPAGARSPIKSEAFHAAASRIQAGFAAGSLATMRDDPMDCDDIEQREPSSSSHDAKLARPNRSRTTPDAKRAQNRESAKRFRVAQKKRWAELQETVERKDEEIEKLKAMLQEVTNNTLERRPAKDGPSMPQPNTAAADTLGVAELSLFVKLMISPPEDGKDATAAKLENRLPAPLAANIGALYRVVVCKTDGCVLGIRHHTPRGREAMGGDVGSSVWEYVEPSDVPHLRFSIVHAPKMAEYNNGEPHVFSYKRRERNDDKDAVEWMRMKGCVYPTRGEDDEITGVLLAEFVEL